MTDLKTVNKFIDLKNFAIFGVSSDKNKFGNYIYSTFKKTGKNIFAVHPTLNTIKSEKVYESFDELPVKPDAVIICQKPMHTINVIKEAHSKGVRFIWMQQGSGSEEAIQYCKMNNIEYVANECVIMFIEGGKFPHIIHRGIWKMIGKYPK